VRRADLVLRLSLHPLFDKTQKEIFDALIDASEAAPLAQEAPLRAALGPAASARPSS
jgi:hypothetical protein